MARKWLIAGWYAIPEMNFHLVNPNDEWSVLSTKYKWDKWQWKESHYQFALGQNKCYCEQHPLLIDYL